MKYYSVLHDPNYNVSHNPLNNSSKGAVRCKRLALKLVTEQHLLSVEGLTDLLLGQADFTTWHTNWIRRNESYLKLLVQNHHKVCDLCKTIIQK